MNHTTATFRTHSQLTNKTNCAHVHIWKPYAGAQTKLHTWTEIPNVHDNTEFLPGPTRTHTHTHTDKTDCAHVVHMKIACLGTDRHISIASWVPNGITKRKTPNCGCTMIFRPSHCEQQNAETESETWCLRPSQTSSQACQWHQQHDDNQSRLGEIQLSMVSTP